MIVATEARGPQSPNLSGRLQRTESNPLEWDGAFLMVRYGAMAGDQRAVAR